MYERTVWENVHGYQVNSMQFLPHTDGRTLITASADGCSKILDTETGMHYTLCDLNPEGWIQGISSERNWRMVHGLAADPHSQHTAFCGDNTGRVRSLAALAPLFCLTRLAWGRSDHEFSTVDV